MERGGTASPDQRISVTAAALLEREHSISVLADMLADVSASSHGRLVAVGGEAGVGKTALLRAFCEICPKPTRILWGACQPLRTPRPLGPLVDVAEATGGELAQLVTGPARPHEVAAALLQELRGRVPAVLVLDDVHWADEATLDVITLLAARVSSAPALVLASYRDDELDRAEQLRVILGEFVRRSGRLRVEPLSRAAVAKLAQTQHVDADELYRRTGGNPFFVYEVLAAVGERIPETVRDAVLARAGRLSDPARRLLEAIAVVPGQVELWLLEELAGGLVDRVDECLASGMLRAAGAQVQFRHELARLAIEEATSPSRGVALHHRALAALAGRGDDAARIAHHAEAAGDVDAVLRWAPRAAERAASSGAHREAAAQYGRAVRFAEKLPLAVRAELLQRRADECYVAAQFDAAIEAQQGSLECHRLRGDRRGEGDALRSLARLMFFAGRTDEGEPLALEAVALLEQLPPGRELAMACATLSQRRMVVDEAEAAVLWGNRALELARRLGDIEAEVYALTNMGAAELKGGGDRSKLERALALAQQHGLEEYAGRAFLQLVYCPMRNREFDVVTEPLQAGLEYCTERGLDVWRLYLLACRARLELELGSWDDAADSVTQVLRDPRSAPVARGWALGVLGLLRVRRGDPHAIAPLDEAHTLVKSTGELMQIAPVAAARAEAAWLSGNDAIVARVTDAPLALAVERRVRWVVGELAYWRRQSGLRDDLPAELVADPYRLAMTGDSARAAALWSEIGCPYEAALALADADDDDAVRRAHDELLCGAPGRRRRS